MANAPTVTVIESKEFKSETYGKVTIQAVFIEGDEAAEGEPYYEIREIYRFPQNNEREDLLRSTVSMTVEGIRKTLEDYDSRHVENSAYSAAYHIGLI